MLLEALNFTHNHALPTFSALLQDYLKTLPREERPIVEVRWDMKLFSVVELRNEEDGVFFVAGIPYKEVITKFMTGQGFANANIQNEHGLVTVFAAL